MGGRLCGYISMPGGLAGVRVCSILSVCVGVSDGMLDTPASSAVSTPRPATRSDNHQHLHHHRQDQHQHHHHRATSAANTLAPVVMPGVVVDVPVPYVYAITTPAVVDLYHCLRPDAHEAELGRGGSTSGGGGGVGSARSVRGAGVGAPRATTAAAAAAATAGGDTMPMLQATLGCVFVKWRRAPARLLHKRVRTLRAFTRCLQKAVDAAALAVDEAAAAADPAADDHGDAAAAAAERRRRRLGCLLLSHVQWGSEMLLHFDSILCSGHAMTYANFQATLARVFHSHGRLAPDWPAALLARVLLLVRVHTDTVYVQQQHQLHRQPQHYSHSAAHRTNSASMQHDTGTPLPTHKKNSKPASVPFMGEVRLVIVRSQCEFVDRDPKRGIVVSLGNVATRLHVTRESLDLTQRGAWHTEGEQEEHAAATPTPAPHNSHAGSDEAPLVLVAVKRRKLEIVLLTAVLRYRAGQDATSTVRDVLTLPNCKLRMVTEEEVPLQQSDDRSSLWPDGGGSEDYHRGATTFTGFGQQHRDHYLGPRRYYHRTSTLPAAVVVDVLEYVTQWDSHLKLGTDYRLYDELKVIFSNLTSDLRSQHRTRTSAAGGISGSGDRLGGGGGGAGTRAGGEGGTEGGGAGMGGGGADGGRAGPPQRPSPVYRFDDCEIELNPQVDVLKGLTPHFDQVLEMFGSSTLKFISSSDEVVRRTIEGVARTVRDLSNAVQIEVDEEMFGVD